MTNETLFNGITKDMFEEYKDIQASGKYNMLSPQARSMSSISEIHWLTIIKNYDELERKYSC